MAHAFLTYPTLMRQRRFAGKLFALEVIRDLDEAIDLLCEHLGEGAQADPFAEDQCPYFGILWPAAEGLATHLAAHPELLRGQRVLELGCGLALPSLVAAHLGAEVLATDFHPQVEEFLERNNRHCSLRVPFRRLNWREEGISERFPVVMGSDVLYESRHPGDVAAGLLRFVEPGGLVLLADPGRAYLKPFLRAMEERGLPGERSEYQIEETLVSVYAFRVP